MIFISLSLWMWLNSCHVQYNKASASCSSVPTENKRWLPPQHFVVSPSLRRGHIQGSLSVVLRRRLRHKIISVTFFSGTTRANFLIFGTEHQYGELYHVRQFRICRMSTSCLTELRIFLISKISYQATHVFPGRLTTKFNIGAYFSQIQLTHLNPNCTHMILDGPS